MPGDEKEGMPVERAEPVVVEQSSPPKPRDTVLYIEPGKYTITVGTVTAVSTTANASFDNQVSVFSERIRESAAKTLKDDPTPVAIGPDDGEAQNSIPDEPSAAEER